MTLLVLILGFPIWFPLLITAFCLLLTAAIVLGTIAIVLPWSLIISFGASALALLVATPIVFVNEGIGAILFALGAALIAVSLVIFCLWLGLRLAKFSVRAIAAMFKGFFKLLFGRR